MMPRRRSGRQRLRTLDICHANHRCVLRADRESSTGPMTRWNSLTPARCPQGNFPPFWPARVRHRIATTTFPVRVASRANANDPLADLFELVDRGESQVTNILFRQFELIHLVFFVQEIGKI